MLALGLLRRVAQTLIGNVCGGQVPNQVESEHDTLEALPWARRFALHDVHHPSAGARLKLESQTSNTDAPPAEC
ncbi:MAG: hypothetical protein LAP13_09615 [Acidobacteriia bacterium]|nr:hypothetical protein [Terriglobia bacterium]